jgi:hypothetical protein
MYALVTSIDVWFATRQSFLSLIRNIHRAEKGSGYDIDNQGLWTIKKTIINVPQQRAINTTKEIASLHSAAY